jgi:hypothetical protein
MLMVTRQGNRITVMSEIAIEQAQFRRDDNGPPYLQVRSPGFEDDWLPGVERLLVGFGVRTPGVACPAAVFAQPLGVLHVAVIKVADRPDGSGLLYHVLVCRRPDYERFLGNPFALARQVVATREGDGPLPTLTMPHRPPPPRTVVQVQSVLRRVKAGALKENEDPEHPDFQRTTDNSESPALLGGVQVLVEGGKLVFERPAPDPDLVEGLWTLLPQSTRARLWPASFAFGNALGFDVLVVPRLYAADYEGYTSEDQAADYPAGHYETALQVAAETGNERDLDALLNRRSGGETVRLGWTLLVAVALLALAPRLLDLFESAPPTLDSNEKAAVAAGMVAAGDPWTALGLRLYGHTRWRQP